MSGVATSRREVARPAGLEPATPGLESQLSVIPNGYIEGSTQRMVRGFRCLLRALHGQSAANLITDSAYHPVRILLRPGTRTTAIFPHALILSFGYHDSTPLFDSELMSYRNAVSHEPSWRRGPAERKGPTLSTYFKILR